MKTKRINRSAKPIPRLVAQHDYSGDSLGDEQLRLLSLVGGHTMDADGYIGRHRLKYSELMHRAGESGVSNPDHHYKSDFLCQNYTGAFTPLVEHGLVDQKERVKELNVIKNKFGAVPSRASNVLAYKITKKGRREMQKKGWEPISTTLYLSNYPTP